MASTKPNRVPPPEDDEDEDAAFHSADEGDGPDDVEEGSSDLKTPTASSHGPKPAVVGVRTPAPKVLELVEPHMRTAPKPKEAEAVRAVEESPQIESPGGDGWDLDDWGASADDEEAKSKNSDIDDVMTTPASERPPTVVQQRSAPNVDEDETVGEQEVPQKPSSLWGGWGQQLLSLATDSISTLTNTVGESLTSVLETVETSLGAPTPEELAILSAQERDALRKKADQVKEPAPVGEKDDCDSASEEVSSEGGSDIATNRSDKEEQLSSGYQSEGTGYQRGPGQMDTSGKRDQGFTSLISGMSHLFENTGKTIVSGSLDVLETLGRKTFETVTVTESLGESQRRRLKLPIPTSGDRSEKPTLSHILRELKEKAEVEAKQKQQEQEARRCNYASLFEDAQGLVHLEALELLSTTCCQQTRSLMELLTPDQFEEVAASMENLKSLFEATDGRRSIDEEPTEQDLASAFKQDLKFTSFSPSRLLTLDDEARTWITQRIAEQDKGVRVDAKEIYEKCMSTLATFTAAGVEMHHKLGQLLLVPNAFVSKSCDAADSLAVRSLISITRTLSDELSFLSSRYTTALNTASDDSEDPDSVSRMLTNVFYEASNSIHYVQEAFRLMLPVVQLASVRERLR